MNGACHVSQGSTPNLFWRSVSLEELRAHSLYTGLPEAPPSLQPPMYRYLRQESPLWSALHQGLLSGSSINAVLGFYEPQAAKRLRIPSGYVGHGKLLAAYRNLQLPAYVPSPADIANFGSAQAQQQLQEAALALASVPAASELHVAPAWSETADAERTSVDMTGKSKARGGSKQRRGRRKGGVPPPVQAAGQALLGTKTITTYAQPSSAEKELQLHRLSVCMRKAAEGIGAVRCKWGNTQEATALFELMHALPEGSLEEVGLCMVDPVVLQERYGFAPGRLPPMGATPDGLMRQRHSSPAASALSALRSAFGGLSIRDCSRSALELEVVEVKNACPYRQVTSLNKKGHAKVSYALTDGGPHHRVARNWVAQLQLEMLAAPADSALLVSRSASKGLTIYRMWRDEEYIQVMLGFVSRLYTVHVLPGRPPPANMFWGLPEFSRFLEHTVALADGAAMIAHVPPAEVQHAANADHRAFL